MRSAERVGSGSRLTPAPALEGGKLGRFQENMHKRDYCGILVPEQACATILLA